MACLFSYLIQQRQQGSYGAQDYLSCLKLLTDSVHDRSFSIKPGITSTADAENVLRHQFRLLRLSEAMLNLHPDGISLNRTPILPFQRNEILESFSKARRNFYEKYLKTNGLMMDTTTGEQASPLKSSVKQTYVDFMDRSGAFLILIMALIYMIIIKTLKMI